MIDFRKLSHAEYLFICMGIIIVYAIGFLHGKYLKSETMAILTIIAILFFCMFSVLQHKKKLIG